MKYAYTQEHNGLTTELPVSRHAIEWIIVQYKKNIKSIDIV